MKADRAFTVGRKPSYTVDRVLAEPVARFIQTQHSPHCVLNLDFDGVQPAPTDFEKKLEDMNEYGSVRTP